LTDACEAWQSPRVPRSLTSALWAALALVAALWPARLAGPLDGVPLDTPLEAITIGVVGVALVLFEPRVLRQWSFRGAVLALLAWKAATGALLTQDGWCLKFTTPQPVFRDIGLVPHSWDVRADWQSPDPECSALMTRSYASIDRFPVWFFNLPPADPKETPTESDRPPLATLRLQLSGFLDVRDPGVLRVHLGEDMTGYGRVDDAMVTAGDLAEGINLGGGVHRVSIEADLRGDRWRIVPTWDGEDLWHAEKATLRAPTGFDPWIRPWGRYVPALLIAALVVMSLVTSARMATAPMIAYALLLSGLAISTVATGRTSLIRAFPLLLISAGVVRWPHRATNLIAMRWLIAVPFLSLIVAIGLPQVGAVTWYSGGDDWWMFQRFAYRIVMQGYWLEGGTLTFWFQPLYRWIAGILHVIFGDSSVGELFWDGACLLTAACFAFHITRRFAGFRWGLAAAVVTLTVFTLGPGWYLIGRGLSEISSAGFVYGAALLALRGRAGSRMAAFGAGILATLGFYARLNNLPMMLAVAAFAWPVREPIAALWTPATLWRRASRPVLLGVLAAAAAGLWLFTARTWYYTGVLSMLFGTQAGTLSVWQPTDQGESMLQNVIGSLLMVLTMNDPPRFDVRSVPVVAGAVVALLAFIRVRPFRALPFNAVILCLAGLSGALVARGTAYPGRFSIHLVPVTVALFVCAISLIRARPREPAA
jgi:hypothetical protein